MNRFGCFLFFAALALSPLVCQEPNPTVAADPAPDASMASQPAAQSFAPTAPFSRFALGGGLGINGINLQAATIVNRHTNVRVIGNVFGYSVNNIQSNGFTGNGKLDLATMGISADFYPFPLHGFRVSPGLLVFNQNSLSASAIVSSGTSFTLNHVQYFSSASDPVHASVRVGLNGQNPALTLTTGWGNMIGRTGKRWSIPFELGAAFIGGPTLKMTLTGTACDATGQNCMDTATNTAIQNNLQAQIAKYRSDLNGLKVFPILSVGFSYNFPGFYGAR